MTREATSQGRRGGIFLASRVFFLAMFAVVALRSTTVLATMESVSGDTAVDHGGDVAHIRGRKLTQQTGPYTYDLATKFALVDISSTISSGDYKFGGVATASNGKTSSRHIKRTAWECLTRATTASCWWTSHRPSLLT